MTFNAWINRLVLVPRRVGLGATRAVPESPSGTAPRGRCEP